MPIQVDCKIVAKEKLASNIYKFSVKNKEIAEKARPGNFLEIKVSDSLETFLRRPISIYNIDKENEIVEFIFQVKGKGTEKLSERKVGDDLNILGPLGNGVFSIKPYKRVAIVGGGIGIYPLYELAKNLKESEVNIYLGFRNKDLVTLEDEFSEIAKIVVKKNLIEFMRVGPLPMLKAIQEFAKKEGIVAEISLEERMGCGIGACVGCAVLTQDSEGNQKYKYVCQHGPVFNSKDVII